MADTPTLPSSTWVCADCYAPHDNNHVPCKCGSHRVVLTEVLAKMLASPDVDEGAPGTYAKERARSSGQGQGAIRSFDEEQIERDVEAARARFSYQPPKPEDAERYQGVGAAMLLAAEAIVRNVPAGRERSTALTCLSEARMHANAGIALHGTKGA